MNKVAFDVSIHVCLPREREVFGVGGGGIIHILIIFYVVGFVSLVWSFDRVTEVAMDGLVYYPFHFVEKNNLEHARKNSKVLRVVRREGEFFTIPAVFALEGSKEKKLF